MTIRNSRRVQSYTYKKFRNATQAQILAAIWHWQPYAKLIRNGRHWIAKTDKDLQADGVTAEPRAIRDAIAQLEKLGLISRTRGPHPNGRAPNSRYIRLSDALFTELEKVATGDGRDTNAQESAINSSKKLNSSSQNNGINAADQTASKGPMLPRQHGDTRRFHRQKTDKDTYNKTNISFEKRSRVGNSTRRIESKTPPKIKPEISADILAVHAAFDDGCRTHPSRICRAPALDTAERIRQVRRYIDACSALGLSSQDAAEASKLFAAQYDADRIARELAKPTASTSPNYHVLAMCANLAVADLMNKQEKKPKKLLGVSSLEDDDAC